MSKDVYVFSLKQILTDWQDKKGDKRFLKLGKDPDLAASSRHSKPKKQKLDGKGSHGPGPGPGRPKSKNIQTKVQEFEFEVDPQDIPRNPKNDAPNRFVDTECFVCVAHNVNLYEFKPDLGYRSYFCLRLKLNQLSILLFQSRNIKLSVSS